MLLELKTDLLVAKHVLVHTTANATTHHIELWMIPSDAPKSKELLETFEGELEVVRSECRSALDELNAGIPVLWMDSVDVVFTLTGGGI